MFINLIVICDTVNGIVKHNVDKTRFDEITKDKIVIMGRKTFEFLNAQSQNRQNTNWKNIIILSRNQLYKPENTNVFHDFGSLYKYMKHESTNEYYVVGGENVFSLFLPLANRVYLTRVYTNLECNIFFPNLNNSFIIERISDEHICPVTKLKFRHIEYIKESTLNENVYLDLLRDVLKNGRTRDDRTGTGTISTFGHQIRFDVSKVVPLLTTKKMAWKTCIKELLWFLRGETDAKILQNEGVHIWDLNSSREFLDKRGLQHLHDGDIGAGYGFQWRHFGADYKGCNVCYSGQGIDQINYIIQELKENPFSRRIMMSSWNAVDLEKMSLPPCHVSAQFYVEEVNGKRMLSCHLYQRSVDCFLGLPFNIFSYTVLIYLLATWCDLHPCELIISTGDTHIYKDHVKCVEEQLSRSFLFAQPKLVLDPVIKQKTIDELTIDDFALIEYHCHKPISAKMSA